MRSIPQAWFTLGAACIAFGVCPRRAYSADSPPPEPELAEVLAGGRICPLQRDAASAEHEVIYTPVKIDQSDLPLSFKIVSRGGDARPVVRLSTRMEGLESEWKDGEGMMWLVLRFLDADNHAISSVSYERRRESPGWVGVPQGSRFYRATEEAVVPGGARKVQLLLVSGGTPRTTGFWAMRRLRLLAARPGEGRLQEIFALHGLAGKNLSSRRGSPVGWVRDGTSLATPQIFSLGGPKAEPMLALIDVDPLNTGGWLATADQIVPVEPGMRLQLETEEMYSIGRGDDVAVAFNALPVGHYVFVVQAADEFGRATGRKVRIPVQVLAPVYQRPWFRVVSMGFGMATLLGLVRYVTWRKMQRELQRAERRRAVEEERTRIARDIHDEMGSRLTQISILAARAEPGTGGGERPHETLTQIQTATRELVTALDEIVWAANPRLDTLESVGNYLSQYADTVLRNAGLRCRFDIPALLPARPISTGVRHRFMMAVKEALTNVLKHARATEVQVRLAYAGDTLEVTIADNGVGFDPTQVYPGDGLQNLRQRLSDMGGACTIESAPGQGTAVTLRLVLPREEESS